MRVYEHVNTKTRELTGQAYCLYGRHYTLLENTRLLPPSGKGPPRRICNTCEANRKRGQRDRA